MMAYVDTSQARAFLRALFRDAVAQVHPQNLVAPFLPPLPKGRIFVVGAGKASAAMAAAVEAAWPDADLSGLVVTRYGHAAPCARIKIIEAGHPVPDATGLAAAQDMLEIAASAGHDDLLLCLMSGGGSALVALPRSGLTLADKQDISRRLLASGAPIGDINRVRIALSAIKGGRLAAAAAPAKVVTLVVSDIPGDNPALVASGPSIPSAVLPAEALAILSRWNIDLSERVRACLQGPLTIDPPRTDIESSPDVRVIAAPAQMLEAAARQVRNAGIEVVILGDAIEGEARVVAAGQARRVRRCLAATGRRPPLMLLSGGETSVTQTGAGRGGRNGEFLLALLIALEGVGPFAAIACDSDGIDGSEDNAGAVADHQSLACARALGLDPEDYLTRNDSYSFFAALGDLIVTGPTQTNVNDFRAVLIFKRR
jgi:glycerate 2-kinase